MPAVIGKESKYQPGEIISSCSLEDGPSDGAINGDKGDCDEIVFTCNLSHNSEQLVFQNPILSFPRSYVTKVLRTKIPARIIEMLKIFTIHTP